MRRGVRAVVLVRRRLCGDTAAQRAQPRSHVLHLHERGQLCQTDAKALVAADTEADASTNTEADAAPDAAPHTEADAAADGPSPDAGACAEIVVCYWHANSPLDSYTDRVRPRARRRGLAQDRRCAPRQRRAADLRRGLALDRRRDPRRDRRLFPRHYRHRARRCVPRPDRRRCRETRLSGLPHNRLPGLRRARHRGRRSARLPGPRSHRVLGRRPRRRRPPRRRRRPRKRWSRSPRRSVSKAWWPTNLTRTRT